MLSLSITAMRQPSDSLCECVCVCVSAQEPHPCLQMKIINPSSLIFMALTNDSAAVIYWNNPATQIEQATFQPRAHAAAALNVYS